MEGIDQGGENIAPNQAEAEIIPESRQERIRSAEISVVEMFNSRMEARGVIRNVAKSLSFVNASERF